MLPSDEVTSSLKVQNEVFLLWIIAEQTVLSVSKFESPQPASCVSVVASALSRSLGTCVQHTHTHTHMHMHTPPSAECTKTHTCTHCTSMINLSINAPYSLCCPPSPCTVAVNWNKSLKYRCATFVLFFGGWEEWNQSIPNILHGAHAEQNIR